MDLATDSSDPPRRTCSPEVSTRPNPFDDSDVASRKRRRTSLSGSPARSIDGSDPLHHDIGSTDSPSADDETDNAMNIDNRPPTPKTPEQQTLSAHQVPDPPSSKVTINLRKNTQNSGSVPESPAVSTVTLDAESTEQQDTRCDSVPAELDTMHAHSRGSPSSSLSSGSPAVELVTIPDDDDDNLFGAPVEDITLDGQDRYLPDPTDKFPYHEPHEFRHDTVMRLVQYLSQTPMLDESIIVTTQTWLKDYLQFARHSPRTRLKQSLLAHRDMWTRYPEVVLAMNNRKPPLQLDSDLRHVVLDYYRDFIQLTAQLVSLDIATLQLATRQEVTATSEKQYPALFSGNFLHCVFYLTRREQPLDEDMTLSPSQGDKMLLLRKLEMTPEGNLDQIVELVTLLLHALPTFPRLLSTLAYVASVLSNFLGAALYRLLNSSADERLVATAQLDRGHALWIEMTRTLDGLVERSVSQLHSDSMSHITLALAGIYKTCLRGSHQSAIQLKENHQRQHPELSPDWVPEAMAHEWRFQVLGKLIRSSQMQLRVWAVTTMCSELVGVWKRFQDVPEHPMLKHLAECLLRSALIEYILGSNCHPEIIAESANIVGFLVVTRTYQQQHTDRFWHNITCSQDPRVADALVRMIITIINIFDQSHLLDFCTKFLSLPADGFTMPMHKLWDAILNQLMDKAQKDQVVLNYQPYNLCLKLLREFSMSHQGVQATFPELQRVIMQKFKDLLTYGPDEEGRAMIYASCMDDIAKTSPTSLGSLWAILIAIGPATERGISDLTRDYSLPKLLINEFEAAVDAKTPQSSFPVLWGSINHPRRELLLGIIQFQPDMLDEKLGNKLWDLLVGPRSPSPNDREAGWQILNEIVARSESKNPFTRTCLAQHLPRLPSHCFSVGLLDFVKQEVIKLMHVAPDFPLDDEEEVKASCLEQLWTIILTADELGLAGQAIHFLAVDVYMSPAVVSRYPSPRLQQGHSILVNRCFSQLKDAAEQIRAANQVGDSVYDGEAMVIVDGDEQTVRFERIFTRSLQLLRYFLDIYQTRPELSTPDLRAVVSRTPSEVEGDPAQLKYQCFDGLQQTEMKPLSIGKRNTAASLLASLRQETGFQNYKAYFRGRAFHPDVRQLCKSLEDLQMHEGLILVKKTEEKSSFRGRRVKLGSSALQIDILQHFDELWQYLDLKETLASEIYQFLIKLPANYRILETFEDGTASAVDIFPPGHPFKALYTVHALYEYKDLTSQDPQPDAPAIGPRLFPRRTAEEAKASSISLIVQALPAVQEPSQYSQPVQAKLVATMMHVLVQWLQSTDLSDPQAHVDVSSFGITSPDVLIDTFSRAATIQDDANFEVLIHTFEVLLWLGLIDSTFWTSVTSHQPFFDAIRALMLSEAKTARFMIVKKIRDAVTREATLGSRVSQQIAQYFWSLASQLVEDVTEQPERCHDVFELSYFVLRDAHSRWPQDIDFTSLAAKFSDLLLNHTSSESISQATPQDPVVKNLADHLFLCLKADESIIESGSLSESLGYDIFWRHLFPAPRLAFEEPVPTVVLSQETRSQLSKVVFLLAKHDRARLDQLLKDMASLVPVYTAEEDDPYLYELPQGFDRFRAIRSPCGYVGLRNLSNTCYLNSLLTQLYMNVPFRNFLLSSRVHDTGHSNSLLFQTKKLFGFLQESWRRFVDPADMVMCIKTYEDTLIDIHSQMDVDEFYNLLFDRWESQLLNPLEKKKFRAFFGGQLVQQVKSQECEHISERLEPFSAIQCDIKGKTTLAESLQAYVDGEILEGDNKYKCSTCDRHVDAVKRACLKDIPDNVIFHLKRFDFNLRTLQRSKINDYFQFPAKINLAPYTVEHISGEAVEEDMFELVGVLVHAGTAESGHYYSYIRERPSPEGRPTWVEFNDDNVSTWDPSLMEASTFGGANRPQPPDPSGILYDKPYSAYMLFYQRSSALADEGLEVAQRGVPMPVHVPMDSDLKEHILEENTQLLKRHCLFDPSHVGLVRECFNHAKSIHAESKRQLDGEEDADAGALMALAMEVILGHFDQVICRTKDMPLFEDFEAIIKNAITIDSQCAFAFYDYFHNRPVALRSLVQRNVEQRVRHSAGNLFLVALERLAVFIPFVYDSITESRFEHQRELREDFWRQRGCDPAEQPFIVQGVMRVLKHMWKGFPAHIRAWDEFFKMVLGFAKMGDRETAHLLADNFLLKLCRIIMADQMLDLPGPYMRMLQNISRRFPNRPPSFQYIILTADYLLHQLSPKLGPGTIVESPFERLDQDGSPFMWTSDEAATLHIHSSRRRDVSFFVEKLVGHDQAVMATERILIRLIGANEMLDLNIVNSLMNCIRRDDSVSSLDPFLRMSLVYIAHTQHLDRALQLVTHVARQSSRLQVVESPAVLGFFKQALTLKRSDLEFVDQVRAHCVETMPQWAPCLLVHYENGVRAGTTEIIDFEVFGGRVELGLDGDGVPEDVKETALRVVAQRLGIACLEHLRDTFVQHQTHIGRDQAQAIHKVITRCGQAFEMSGETAGDDRSAIFGMLRIEVIEQLRGLVVDDMEEEGSEWDASCVSSEQMDGIAEMSMQVMKDLDDRDTT